MVAGKCYEAADGTATVTILCYTDLPSCVSFLFIPKIYVSR